MLANVSFKDSNVQFALNTLIQGYLKHIYSNDCILNNKTATIMKKKKIQCTTVHQVNCIIYYANVHFSIHPYIQYVRSALLLFTFCHTLSHCTCTIRSFIQWLNMRMIFKDTNSEQRSHHRSLVCFTVWRWRRGSWDQWRELSPLCRSHHRRLHHRFYLEPGRKKTQKGDINTTAGRQHTTTPSKITVQRSINISSRISINVTTCKLTLALLCVFLV